MARYALILADGSVEKVIVADRQFIDNADPAWKARYAAIELADANAEPLAGYNDLTGRFVRPIAGKKWDRATRTFVVDPAYVAPPPTLEERVAAIERNPPPAGATLEERIAALEGGGGRG